MDEDKALDTLIIKIKNKRRAIKAYVNKLKPKAIRLTNLNIVCSTIAMLLTATPAVGGKLIIDILGDPNSNLLTWRMFFLAAAILSATSTIAANIYKARDMASRLANSQACDAKLEGLETLLETKRITVNQAAAQYAELISMVGFISEENGGVFSKHSSLYRVTGKITEPHPDQVVDDNFSCAGWAKDIGKGLHLWLAVEVEGRIWPKERPIPVEDDGSWVMPIHEEGPRDRFSLSLFVANKKDNKVIEAWIRRCNEAASWPELQRPPNMVRLDRVDHLQRKRAMKD